MPQEVFLDQDAHPLNLPQLLLNHLILLKNHLIKLISLRNRVIARAVVLIQNNDRILLLGLARQRPLQVLFLPCLLRGGIHAFFESDALCFLADDFEDVVAINILILLANNLIHTHQIRIRNSGLLQIRSLDRHLRPVNQINRKRL